MNPMSKSAAQRKQAACEAIDAMAATLVAVSHDIWDHPELCFDERYAHDRLVGELEASGLDVTRSAYGLDTAFEANAGSDGPIVAVCCEYDALPDIGHACGHNIIAAAGLGAGIAAAQMTQSGPGRVRILGTPAEEGGGGKVYMIQRGAFDDVSAALMVHPADQDLTSMDTIAMQQLDVRYIGQAAHAAAAPHLGRNALDGAVLGYNALAALRQHIAPTERIHGIFTDGGGKANIVPDHAAMTWYVRSPSLDGLAALKERVLRCVEAGAAAAGVEMEYTWVEPAYSDMVDDDALLASYRANASALGRLVSEPNPDIAVTGSTDMGNVSHVVASIHPMIKAAPSGVAIHTPDFAAHAASPLGDSAVIDGAKAMAMTIIDVWEQA
jgi:amidohydrolase